MSELEFSFTRGLLPEHLVDEHGEWTCGHHAREPASGPAAAVRRHWKKKKSGFAVSGLVIERHRDRQTTSEGRGGGASEEVGECWV